MNTSAPGKLFLVGEYAVLEGGPAILVPVRQRATITMEPAVESEVISHTTGVERRSLDQALEHFPLLQALVTELGCREQLEHAQLTLDTSEFFRNNVKLGLGSSAALTVALVKLFEPDATVIEQLEKAVRCHLAFQKGVGSGADIALAAMDEPIVFQRGESPIPIVIPEDLHMLAIWSGEPASTTGYVEAVNKWQQNDPGAYLSHVGDLHDTAVESVVYLQNKDTQQVLATIEQYDGHLQRLSSVSGVNFYNEAHLEMRKKVELHHCIYKPSGAGGGDFGIAYSTDKNELLTLADKLAGEQTYTFVL